MNVLGIDTSCYTTSIALCDGQGRLILDLRRPLSVPERQTGLRQSEAVFAHIRHLPELLTEARQTLGAEFGFSAIAYSAQPRPEPGSYMPVFIAGVSAARQLAAVLDVPLFATSHQEGHIAAALASCRLDWREPFLALHLSGGTGELLSVSPCADGYALKIIGNCDLPPGQFVDRVGVALGLPFPAGPELEILAQTAVGKDFRLSGATSGLNISFSGPESAAQRAIRAGVDRAQIAAAVLDNIASSLAKVIRRARQETGCQRLLLAGGVAANQRITRRLQDPDTVFSRPHFASDNAFGTALLGLRHFQENHNGMSIL